MKKLKPIKVAVVFLFLIIILAAISGCVSSEEKTKTRSVTDEGTKTQSTPDKTTTPAHIETNQPTTQPTTPALATYSLKVNKDGFGTGNVISSPGGINCGTDCSESYTSGTKVTLTATAAEGSRFYYWNGAYAGFSTTFTLTMDSDKELTANFAQSTATTEALTTVTVNKAGSGSGTVVASYGINCGANCNEVYPRGVSIVLRATPAGGSKFAGWGGACIGTIYSPLVSECTLNIDTAKTVTAEFNKA